VSFQSREIGVGSENPEAFPAMPGIKRGSGYNVPEHIIPAIGKLPENPSKSATAVECEEGSGILQ
jgi:hypothetical protein